MYNIWTPQLPGPLADLLKNKPERAQAAPGPVMTMNQGAQAPQQSQPSAQQVVQQMAQAGALGPEQVVADLRALVQQMAQSANNQATQAGPSPRQNTPTIPVAPVDLVLALSRASRRDLDPEQKSLATQLKVTLVPQSSPIGGADLLALMATDMFGDFDDSVDGNAHKLIDMTQQDSKSAFSGLWVTALSHYFSVNVYNVTTGAVYPEWCERAEKALNIFYGVELQTRTSQSNLEIGATSFHHFDLMRQRGHGMAILDTPFYCSTNNEETELRVADMYDGAASVPTLSLPGVSTDTLQVEVELIVEVATTKQPAPKVTGPA